MKKAVCIFDILVFLLLCPSTPALAAGGTPLLVSMNGFTGILAIALVIVIFLLGVALGKIINTKSKRSQNRTDDIALEGRKKTDPANNILPVGSNKSNNLKRGANVNNGLRNDIFENENMRRMNRELDNLNRVNNEAVKGKNARSNNQSNVYNETDTSKTENDTSRNEHYRRYPGDRYYHRSH